MRVIPEEMNVIQNQNRQDDAEYDELSKALFVL